MAVFLVVSVSAAPGGQSGTRADVCALVDLRDGPRLLAGLDGAPQYYAEVRDAARMVDDPDLSAIADSYDRAVHAIDQVEGVAREDLAWTEAIKDIKVSELVGICIDRRAVPGRPAGLAPTRNLVIRSATAMLWLMDPVIGIVGWWDQWWYLSRSVGTSTGNPSHRP